jgi:hypothetical protein
VTLARVDSTPHFRLDKTAGLRLPVGLAARRRLISAGIQVRK